MNGRQSLSKNIGRIKRSTKTGLKKEVPEPEIPQGLDVGSWRITQDENGALVIYNFDTGNKIILAR